MSHCELAKRLHDKLQHALHATAAACGEGLDDGEC